MNANREVAKERTGSMVRYKLASRINDTRLALLFKGQTCVIEKLRNNKSTEEKLSKRKSPVLSAGDTRDQKEPESCHRFAKPEQTLVNEKLSGGTG